MAGLAGKSVLVTRARNQAASFSEKIKQAGGNPIEVPLLCFSLRNSQENKHLIAKLHEYTWVFFTSSNGVKFFFELWEQTPYDWPSHIHIGVVGEKTEQVLEQYGVFAEFVPSTYTAEVMAKEFLQTYSDPGSVLFVRGNLSRDILPKALEQHVFFQKMTVYDTLPNREAKQSLYDVLEKHALDAYTFTSPSTIQAFTSMVCNHANYKWILSIPCVCIGPTTEEQAKKAGFSKILTPQKHFTVDGMLERMEGYFNKKG